MSSFAAWGLTILGLATVCTVAEMLLPRGKTRSVIRSVFATVAVLVIVTPIPSLIKHGVHFDFPADSVSVDSGYIEYIDEVKRNIIVRAACDYLDEKGYKDGYTLSVELDGDWNVKSATLDFSGSGMTDEISHIHKSEIVRLVAEYFGIGEEAVMKYG